MSSAHRAEVHRFFEVRGYGGTSSKAFKKYIRVLSNLLYLPMVFGSDAFYSLQNAPSWITAIGKYFPFAYFVEGMRAAVHGNFSAVVLPLMLVAGFTAVIVMLAALTFRWDSDQPLLGKKM